MWHRVNGFQIYAAKPFCHTINYISFHSDISDTKKEKIYSSYGQEQSQCSAVFIILHEISTGKHCIIVFFCKSRRLLEKEIKSMPSSLSTCSHLDFPCLHY